MYYLSALWSWFFLSMSYLSALWSFFLTGKKNGWAGSFVATTMKQGTCVLGSQVTYKSFYRFLTNTIFTFVMRFKYTIFLWRSNPFSQMLSIEPTDDSLLYYNGDWTSHIARSKSHILLFQWYKSCIS